MKFIIKYLSFFSIFEFFLCLFVFLLPWQTIFILHESFLNGSKLEYQTIGIYAVEIILWCNIIFALFAWKLKNNQQKNIFRVIEQHENKVLFGIGIFLVYVFFSFLWALDKPIALIHGFRLLEATIIIFFIFFSTVEAKKLLEWFVAGSVVQSVLGIYQFFTQSTFSFKWLGLLSHPVLETGTSVIQSDQLGRWLRAYGAFPHPNIFAGYLMVGLICTALLFSFFQKKKDQLIILLICWILQFMALFFTFSRSAWVSSVICISMLFIFGVYTEKKYRVAPFAKKTRMFVISALILIVGMVVVYFPFIQTRARVQSFHEVRSVEERKSAFKQGWDIFVQHPFFGVGAGNYTLAVKDSDLQVAGSAIHPVHNVFLLFVCELGLVGLLIFFVHIRFCLQKNKGKNLIILGIIGIFVPILFLDHYVYSLPTGIFFFSFLLGIAKKYFSTVYPQNIH